MWVQYKKSGFTIVELLIVIVVIAILAAISIVAYNGIQTRARNTARVHAAKDFHKIVLQYQTINGAVIGSGSYCLGDGHTDSDADGTPDCYANNTKYNENVTINNRIKQISSRSPVFPDTTVQVNASGNISNGIAYNTSNTRTVNGVIQPALLIYILEGNAQDCGTSSVVRSTGTNTYETGNYTYTTTNSYSTTCYITLPRLEDM